MCPESTAEVVGIYEVGEMLSWPLVILVMAPFDGSFLDGLVHPLDLPVGLGMLDFSK